ncbi:hypothetical protein V2W30_40715 (plasmid) [Streptomyces sp. Q6]|uniref:Uncharacterized protein n=1 Tax=Streptomyces citrinus TaxID=3118173 RepID=A0ACD5AQN4_9ACTN
MTIATRIPAIAQPLLEELPGSRAVALDVSDLASVRAFCADWSGPVDALVANAGVMLLPTCEVNAHGWETQLSTNYLGHCALVPGLRSRRPGTPAGSSRPCAQPAAPTPGT